MAKRRKYLLKIGSGDSARYFYTQAEVNAYRKEKNNEALSTLVGNHNRAMNDGFRPIGTAIEKHNRAMNDGFRPIGTAIEKHNRAMNKKSKSVKVKVKGSTHPTNGLRKAYIPAEERRQAMRDARSDAQYRAHLMQYKLKKGKQFKLGKKVTRRILKAVEKKQMAMTGGTRIAGRVMTKGVRRDSVSSGGVRLEFRQMAGRRKVREGAKK